MQVAAQDARSIRTVRLVGVPSSSTFSEPRRLAIVPSSMTVQSSSRALTEQVGERRGALAVEVALEAVADRLVKQDPRPPRSEDDRHLAGGGVHRVEVQDRLPRGFPREAQMAVAVDEEAEGLSPTAAVRPLLTAVRVLGDAGDVQTGERLDVAHQTTVGGRDHHELLLDRERGKDVLDARVVGAGGAIDGFEEGDLGRERRVERQLGSV